MASLPSLYDSGEYLAGELSPRTGVRVYKPREAQSVRAAKKEKERREPLARLVKRNYFWVCRLLFFPVKALHSALDWGLLISIAVLIVLFGWQFPHPPAWDRHWVILHLHELADPLLAQFSAWSSSEWPSSLGAWSRLEWPSSSTSYLPFSLAVSAWVVKTAVDAVFLPTLRLLGKRAPACEWVPEGVVSDGWWDSVPADSEEARNHLITRYRKIDRALKKSKRKHCAFLSIDIAGSTQMKEGEKEMAITVTFQAYIEMVEKILDHYGAWKQAWTPDGVMVCFLHLELAVAAAQTILQRLRKFNRMENMLRTPITVRCGLNEGEVAIFEDSKLEKISHGVIDIAGHMQKHANPNTLWVGAEVFDSLSNKSGFRAAGLEVDSQPVYEWSLRRS